MVEHRELIERLMKLDGPDREVDALIWCVEAPEIKRILPHWTEAQREEIVPRFTESLDAAVDLVERLLPGMSTSLLRKILERNSHRPVPYVPRDSATSWLARNLCIALLRALEGGNKP